MYHQTAVNHHLYSDLKSYCRIIENFPKPGISFKDITPLLQDKNAFGRAIRTMSNPFYNKVDAIVCIESRGFIIGSAMAFHLHCGLVPIRKKGKLPAKTHSVEYNLEYGKDILEIHADAIKINQRILIVDDVLATGGTAQASIKLVQDLNGYVIGCAFLGELTELNGRKNISVPVHSLIKF